MSNICWNYAPGDLYYVDEVFPRPATFPPILAIVQHALDAWLHTNQIPNNAETSKLDKEVMNLTNLSTFVPNRYILTFKDDF